MVAALVVVVKLQEQLPAQERELDSRENPIAMREDGLAAFECFLGRACKERDAEHERAEVVQQDYLARTYTFTTSCWCSFSFDRILQQRRILLSLQEMDLER
jgi:hypothetical protein